MKEAYQACEEIIRKHSKTFYKAFSFLPEENRNAVWAIYAFCRRVDDIVDEGENPEVEIIQFKEEFSQFAKGERLPESPYWTALHDVFQRFQMELAPFEDMIEGQEMDLSGRRYHSINELESYCYHVAGTVGLMLLPVLAPGKERILRDGAISLGIAMQYTNILRDIGEDLTRNRLYLPKETMMQHGYSADLLEENVVNSSFVSLWESLAERAEAYYEEAMETISHYPSYSQIPVQSAAIFYRSILDSVRSNGHNVFSKRAYVSDIQKEKLLAERLG
ncbi:phytoene/squalene synthase family protein [Rossellomorea vietnamensis]|uniref:Phytoene/squalene synthase family protein n=1 Tax=Rossellomorea vietnamensis TaxID=218284 RepID=A0A5D4MCF8_9BACI|nr:phytoene/squalene synthase family protein [Rossellomorea vietnamensis]TYR99137.1 phytoene/squalene synthase family protein [Rossellomorea vietnamensis]